MTEAENEITIETLFELHSQSLELEWIAGQQGKNALSAQKKLLLKLPPKKAEKKLTP